MENKFERELTKDVLVSNEHNRENINAKMNYDLSLLTKEVFEELEYEAAALKIPFLIDREQAFGNLIYGNIDILRHNSYKSSFTVSKQGRSGPYCIERKLY